MTTAHAPLSLGLTIGLLFLVAVGSAVGQQTPLLSRSEKIVAVDGATGDRFGVSVGLTSDVAVVGAHWDDAPGVDSGSAHVYERQADGSWPQTARLIASDGAPHDRFGAGVGVSGERVVVGSFWDDDLGEKSGSAYVYERQGDGTWLEAAKLLAADGEFFDLFGDAVGVSGDVVAIAAIWDETDDLGGGVQRQVGTPQDQVAISRGTGSAYIYQR